MVVWYSLNNFSEPWNIYFMWRNFVKCRSLYKARITKEQPAEFICICIIYTLINVYLIIWMPSICPSLSLSFCVINVITLCSFYYWWTFGFFQFETITNFAAINVCLHSFRWTHIVFLLDLYVKVELPFRRLAFIKFNRYYSIVL